MYGCIRMKICHDMFLFRFMNCVGGCIEFMIFFRRLVNGMRHTVERIVRGCRCMLGHVMHVFVYELYACMCL
jgi:hypothetical protein